jgi:hypothetical protein
MISKTLQRLSTTRYRRSFTSLPVPFHGRPFRGLITCPASRTWMKKQFGEEQAHANEALGACLRQGRGSRAQAIQQPKTSSEIPLRDLRGGACP